MITDKTGVEFEEEFVKENQEWSVESSNRINQKKGTQLNYFYKRVS